MAANTKTRAPADGTSNVRITAAGRAALDRIAERMGWEVFRTTSAVAVLAEQATDEQLLEAMRRLNEAESQ